jgi:N6-adenosine-specific RNA methylase IME4
VPLVVTEGNVIISGERRWKAAGEAGREVVPVAVFPSTDELNILEALVHFNKQRVKTRNQTAGEAAALLRVERERARKRQEQAATQTNATLGRRVETLGEPVPEACQSGPGRARDNVGKALGMSGKTAERAAAVAEAIWERGAKGQSDIAQMLKETLNSKGVAAAYRMLGVQTKAKAEPAAQKDGTSEPDQQTALHVNNHPKPALGMTTVGPVSEVAENGHRSDTPRPYEMLLVAPPQHITAAQLRQMPIGDKAAADAFLLLLTTGKTLADSVATLVEWGFSHEGVVLRLWNERASRRALLFTPEFWLVGVRGSAHTRSCGDDAIRQIDSDELKDSTVFYERIESWCGGPKAEVFVRSNREGWIVLGEDLRPTATS